VVLIHCVTKACSPWDQVVSERHGERMILIRAGESARPSSSHRRCTLRMVLIHRPFSYGPCFGSCTAAVQQPAVDVTEPPAAIAGMGYWAPGITSAVRLGVLDLPRVSQPIESVVVIVLYAMIGVCGPAGLRIVAHPCSEPLRPKRVVLSWPEVDVVHVAMIAKTSDRRRRRAANTGADKDA